MIRVCVLLSLLFYMFQSAVFSQENEGAAISDTVTYEPKLEGELFISSESLNGTPFLHGWSEGDVYLNTGTVYHKTIKYNNYKDALIWLCPSHNQMVDIEKESIKGFKLGSPWNEIYRKIWVKDPVRRDSVPRFMQILFEGKYSLYVFRHFITSDNITVQEGNKTFNQNEIIPHFVYYIKLPDNSMISFTKIRKRAFFKIFADRKKELRKLFRKNRVTIESETDLVSAVKLIQKYMN